MMKRYVWIFAIVIAVLSMLPAANPIAGLKLTGNIRNDFPFPSMFKVPNDGVPKLYPHLVLTKPSAMGIIVSFM